MATTNTPDNLDTSETPEEKKKREDEEKKQKIIDDEAARKKKAAEDAEKKEPQQVGIALVTKGSSFDWTGGDKSSVSLSRSLSLKLGIDTTVTLSAASSLSVGVSTKVDWAAGFAASYGYKLDYDQVKKTKLTKSETIDAAEWYSVRVSADLGSKAKRKTLETKMKIMIGVQVAALGAFAATILGTQIYASVEDKKARDRNAEKSKQRAEGKDVGDDEITGALVTDVYFGKLKLSTLQALWTAVSGMLTIALIAYSRVLSKFQADPLSAMTLDHVSGAFIGTQVKGVSPMASGLTLSQTGVLLETSKNATLDKANDTILGLQHTGVGGATLAMSPEGKIGLLGTGLTVSLPTNATTTKTTIDMLATEHRHEVIGNGASAQFKMNKDEVILEYDQKNGLILSKDLTTVLSDNAMLMLRTGVATLSVGGIAFTVNRTGIEMKFGPGSTFKIDATGFTMGDLKVLSPGAPALTSPDLVKAVANLATKDALSKTERKLSDTQRQLEKKQRQLSEVANKALVKSRTALELLDTMIPGGPT